MWKIRKIIDLSQRLDGDTPVYPGDPVPRISADATISGKGFNTHTLYFSTHAGTHVDAPCHTDPAGETVELVDLCRFAGEGIMVPLKGKEAGEGITVADLKPYAPRFAPGTVVLLHTGWDKKAGSGAYFKHPHLEEEACRYILARGVAAIGIDAISIDACGGGALTVHRLVAAAGGVIIENLANLEQVDFPRPLVIFFPLKLPGCDGSPVRAVALQLEAG